MGMGKHGQTGFKRPLMPRCNAEWTADARRRHDQSDAGVKQRQDRCVRTQSGQRASSSLFLRKTGYLATRSLSRFLDSALFKHQPPPCSPQPTYHSFFDSNYLP